MLCIVSATRSLTCRDDHDAKWRLFWLKKNSIVSDDNVLRMSVMLVLLHGTIIVYYQQTMRGLYHYYCVVSSLLLLLYKVPAAHYCTNNRM